MSDKVWDFRREGGKKPSVRRGMRAISTFSGMPGMETKYSCLYSGSRSELWLGVSDGDMLSVSRGKTLLESRWGCSVIDEVAIS